MSHLPRDAINFHVAVNENDKSIELFCLPVSSTAQKRPSTVGRIRCNAAAAVLNSAAA